MDYAGEHLLPGQLGRLFTSFSLVASLIACFAYFKAARSIADEKKWLSLARVSFYMQGISVFAVFGALFYIINNHLFEYKYAWQHSSLSLEWRYLLACFWEGQEGSFLLWSIWHCFLGLILIKKTKDWEAPVMTVVSFAQFALFTMITGISLFGHKLGTSPFALLRDEMNAPIFSNPNYLSMIKDGNDLNPLLQNYWMVIHPPVLFMGFASAIVPFAFAIAGLWKKKYREWVKPALPWALFSGAVLGTGIMMGAMWAYESLTFGGYWAWDPVENASLVPWLVLISGIHAMLVYLHTGRSLRTMTLLIILSFLLVLYSTFLTRSGILGDTSVHAFTSLGMNAQLLILVLVFAIPSLVLYVARYRSILVISKPENISSREFWMFIGSMTLLFSAFSIILMTSVPVFNRVAGYFVGENKHLFTPLAIGENSEFSYNRIQILVAIIIAVLTATIQFLKYKHTALRLLIEKITLPALLSILLGALIITTGKINYDKHGTIYQMLVWLAVVSSIYSVIANIYFVGSGLRGKFRLAGSSIAHAGFGLMLLGILISSSKKEVLSLNSTGIEIPMGENSNERPGENLTLLKGVRTSMGKFWVTYQSDSANSRKPLWYYKIRFESKDKRDSFALHPSAFVNYKGNDGLMSNPDSRHYWSHDIFSYITSLPAPENKTDPSLYKVIKIKQGDTISYLKKSLVLEKITEKNNIPGSGFDPDDMAKMASVKIISADKTSRTALPVMIRKKNQYFLLSDTLADERLVLQLRNVEGKFAELGIKEINPVIEYVTLKVYKFPFINLLWVGTAIMMVGFIMSIVKRVG